MRASVVLRQVENVLLDGVLQARSDLDKVGQIDPGHFAPKAPHGAPQCLGFDL